MTLPARAARAGHHSIQVWQSKARDLSKLKQKLLLVCSRYRGHLFLMLCWSRQRQSLLQGLLCL